jgi:hypothetical protein
VLKLELALGVVVFALWVFCLIDVLGSPDHRVRALPKLGWFVLVLLFPLIGSILWLAAGRPEQSRRPRSAYERPAPAFPEYDRPGRAAAATPEEDEAFLRQVRARAEEQRRRYRAQQDPAAGPAQEPAPDPGPDPGADPGADSGPTLDGA